MTSPTLKRFVNVARASVFAALCFGISGCVTTGNPAVGHPSLPEGYYVFDMPVLYSSGMARVGNVARGVRVQLLETFEGSFELHGHGENELRIRNESISYPGLRRTLSGEGTITAPGRAQGEGTVWIRISGPVGRDHRKGPWTLRPATAEEIERHERVQRSLETRRRRAGLEE